VLCFLLLEVCLKLKISVLFLFLAVALIFVTLKRDLFRSEPSGQENAALEKELSKEEVFAYLRQASVTSYLGQPLKLDQAAIDAADIINIHLWASWCAPCVNEVPELIEFANRVTVKNEKNLKVLFVTVSLDETTDDLNKFLKSFPEFNKEPFIRVWDKDKSFSKLVNADRLPMTIILNKNISEPRIVRGVVEWKSIKI
jgi:thiol-disulfide isomerase/thioredoxin